MFHSMSSLASFVKAVEAIRGRLAAVADKKNPASLVQQQRELHEVKNAIVELQLKFSAQEDALRDVNTKECDRIQGDISAAFKQFEKESQRLINKSAGAQPPPPEYSEDDERRHGKQKQQQQQQLGSVDLIEMQQREVDVRQLQSDLRELAQLFADLNTLVRGQQEQLDTIEANISSAAVSTGKGRDELAKGVKLQKKSRRKMLCLLAILVIILIAVAIALAVTFGHH